MKAEEQQNVSSVLENQLEAANCHLAKHLDVFEVPEALCADSNHGAQSWQD
jgi:hypothetical protein